MKKLSLILFLCIASHVAVAQEVYDTVLFDNITFNDSKLFTNHSHIEKYFDILHSRSRLDFGIGFYLTPVIYFYATK